MSVICERCGAGNRDNAAFCGNCGQPLPVASATGALAAHTLLNGRYEIVAVAGRGAMGAVYQAHDFQADRLVAIKEMSDAALGPGRRDAAVEQFRREALLLQALNHPNLVKVTDVFTEGRRHYLVMDYVDGRPLSALAGAGRQLPEAQVRAWAWQLCDALAYLHGRQPPVIFRDLKPDNIMLSEGAGQIKLIDFGIARLFDPAKDRDTIAIGTRGFMAPEAFHEQTDARSDLYSLGVTLHNLLTGYDPAANPWKLPPVRNLAPDVSEELAQIVAHATQLDPDQRFQTAQEFKRALGGEVIAAEEVAAAPGAPVAARVSTARPVRFNGREQVTSLDQFIALCDNQWEAAVNHLRAGEVEVWLEHLGARELARYARELRQQPGADMAVQLEALLEATGRVPPPQLTVAPPLLNLGPIGVQTPSEARLRLRNIGRGLLAGQIWADAPWLAPERPTFADNDTVIGVHIYGDRLPFGVTAEGHLLVRSNGGEAQAPVRCLPMTGSQGRAAARAPAWAPGVLLLLAVAGGAWLIPQLAVRWGLASNFDVAGWLAGGKGWLLWPLAAAGLALAAMIGSVYQWERLASDAPLAEWGKTALWTLGVTALAVLAAAITGSYGLPALIRLAGWVPWEATSRAQGTLPLITGGAAALAVSTRWAAARRRSTGGAVGLVFMILGWVILILAGAAGGVWVGKVLHGIRSAGLPADVWWALTLAGAALTGALGYGLARVARWIR
jgi:serine/threonine-protein kinase